MSERRRIIVPRRGQPWVITLAPDMSDEGLQSCFHIVLKNRPEALRYVDQGLQQSDQVKMLIDDAWPVTNTSWLDTYGEYWLSGASLTVMGGVGVVAKGPPDINEDLEGPFEPELLVLECELVAISQTKEPSGDLCLIVKSGLTFDQAIGLSLQHKLKVVLQEVKE